MASEKPFRTKTQSAAIVGLGSVLMRDDGIGAHLLKSLEAGFEFPPTVRLLDLGTPGPELAEYIEGFDVVIFVDSVNTDGAPGELRIYRREEIFQVPIADRLSSHDPGLQLALVAAGLVGCAPAHVLLIGVIPAEVRLQVGLTPAVRAALPGLETLVLAELEHFGVPYQRRTVPRDPDLWWEREPPLA